MVIALALILLAMPTTVGPHGSAAQVASAQSDALVLRLDTPSGRTFTVTVPNGGRATVGKQNGRTLGLVTTLTEAGRVDVVISAREVGPATETAVACRPTRRGPGRASRAACSAA
jgi:hypothetical protein